MVKGEDLKPRGRGFKSGHPITDGMLAKKINKSSQMEQTKNLKQRNLH